MRTFVLTVVMIGFMAIGASAQEPAGETKLLQEQIAALIRARGEDQKALADLRSQVAGLLKAAPQPKQEDLIKATVDRLEATCKAVGSKLEFVTFSPEPLKAESFTCKR